jgi:hypothetical protein
MAKTTIKDLSLEALLLLKAEGEKHLGNAIISGEEYWFITNEIKKRLKEIDLIVK